MNALIDAAFARARTTMLAMLAIVLAGTAARIAVPVASQPDVQTPFFRVSLVHEGISPEDAERLLAMPLEIELRALEGIEEIRAVAFEGGASVSTRFSAGQDLDQTLLDVREAVDRARPELPGTAEEPVIRRSTTEEDPILQVNLMGADVPERMLYDLALELRDRIELIPGVMDARLQGHREELLEVLIDPEAMDAWEISLGQLIATLPRNNRLIAAGSLDRGEGRFSIKVPSVIEEAEDLFDLPLEVNGDTVVTLGDVATVRRAFKDPTGYARFNGARSIALTIVKRPDANMIDVSNQVKAAVDARRPGLPAGVDVLYSRDEAPLAQRQVTELQGNILTALALVMTVVVAALGIRSALIVGLAIPVSFLFSLIVVYLFGYSFNFVVMFGMLLGLGMLIDGAIVVTEDADRMMGGGADPRAAWARAAKRMFWPVTASVVTTLAAFLPLMFWPGVSGRFMRYLPVTVFAVLSGSLLYALVFGPVLGALFGRSGGRGGAAAVTSGRPASDPPARIGALTAWYARLLAVTTRWSGATVAIVVLGVVAVSAAWGLFGRGMIFFTEEGDQWGQVRVRAQGNFSAGEVDPLVREVEDRVMRVRGVRNVTTVTSTPGVGGRDLIGNIDVEMHGRNVAGRDTASILEEVRQHTRSLAGIEVEVRGRNLGPVNRRPLELELASHDRALLDPAMARIREYMETRVGGLRDVSDTGPAPGIEWNLDVDRARAALYGADVMDVGIAAQLLTNGIKIGEYRPARSDDALDIRVRYPAEWRRLGMLDELRVVTGNGLVPLSNFVRWGAAPRVDSIERLNGIPVEYVRAGTAPGVLPGDKVREITAWLEAQALDPALNVRFRGVNEEQSDAIGFVGVAFLLSLLLMFILLVTQFNSFYQAVLILFAVVLSTAGVLLGLLITGSPFSAVLTGIGVVALAGIVVNNNIVLIDTYNRLRRRYPETDPVALIVRTGTLRLRPVMLTAVTTVCGLLPLAANLSVDLVNRKIEYGGPVSSFWAPLSQAIVAGLTFATLLTLLATPAMLALPHQLGALLGAGRRKWAAR